MYQKKYHIHFVGIGGIGMSGIAELLLNLGYEVSGSDTASTDITDRLKSLGGTVYKGHHGSRIEGADVVVISSAIRPDNPEVMAAAQASVPVIPRAEMLAELMRLKYSIAVAGAHGKTTTTSLIASILAKGGLDPTVVIGGKLKSIGSNALLGQGNFIVAEADESDGSFLKYSPAIAVVTNIDREHLDFYKDIDDIKNAFIQFVDRIPFYGLAVLCLDNEYVQDIIPKIKKRCTTYGMSPQADFHAKNISIEGLKSRYKVYRHGKALGEIVLNLPGIHNVYNSMAGIAVGMELGIPFDIIKNALETLQGVQRRLEIKGEAKGITVVDDYGHHPTEIKTTLQAAKESWPDRRIVVVFQPHRYTRTKALFDDFTRAFYQSDHLVILPIYSAGEKKIEGVDSVSLCEGIASHGHKEVVYIEGHESAVTYLNRTLRKNDVLLTQGAGDVWKVGMAVLDSIMNQKKGIQKNKMLLDQDSRNRLKYLFGSCVGFDEPMSRHTYFRVGGPAEAFIAPENIEQLAKIISWSRDNGIPHIVIGNGSNLLVKDNGIPGIVILLTKCLNKIVFSGKETEPVLVTAMAGVSTQALCSFAIRQGLSGMNFAIGIPGTVGGAIMMNAGTSYGSVSNILDSVNVMISSGAMLKIPKDEMTFSYRKLSWNINLTDECEGEPIIIDGCFRLCRSDPALLKKEAGRILKKRRENQPAEMPSAGSFFKNPTAGKTAGQLIDMAGLKGIRVGGAEISAKHANFIVNTGEASASDILELMQLAQKKVFDKFNINLEPEVKIVGI